MKLYYHPLSGNSRRVLLVADHLAIALERVVVNLAEGEQRGAAHLQRNPNGRVPVLEDEGLTLWESRAIMTYLAEKTPRQTLMPQDLASRADVNRWLYWCAVHMAPANTILVFENFVKGLKGQGAADPNEVRRGEALVKQYASVLDAHLAGKTWVTQDQLTLADFSLAASFALAEPARLPIGEFSHLKAWLGRVQQLDAWKRTAPPAPPRG